MLLGAFIFLILKILKSPTYFNLILSGIVGASISLVRGEGIFIVIVLIIWLSTRTPILRVLVILFVLTLGIAPWLVRNYLVFNKVTPITTSFGFNLWRGHNTIASGTGRDVSGVGIWGSDALDQKLIHLSYSQQYEVERDSVFLKEALSFIRQHPGEESILVAKKLFYFWILDLTHSKALRYPYVFSWGLILLLFLIGLYECWRHAYDVSILLSFSFGMTMIVILFFVLPRYQLILTYGIIPISAIGAVRLLRNFSNIFQINTKDII
jgi:hypothetical protein